MILSSYHLGFRIYKTSRTDQTIFFYKVYIEVLVLIQRNLQLLWIYPFHNILKRFCDFFFYRHSVKPQGIDLASRNFDSMCISARSRIFLSMRKIGYKRGNGFSNTTISVGLSLSKFDFEPDAENFLKIRQWIEMP